MDSPLAIRIVPRSPRVECARVWRILWPYRKCLRSSFLGRPALGHTDFYKSFRERFACCRHACHLTRSHPAICSGDHFRSSFSETSSQSLAFKASLHDLGREARFNTRSCAWCALYRASPPCRLISRKIVDGARFNWRAIARILSFWASPREMSSRSEKIRCRGFLVRLGGA